MWNLLGTIYTVDRQIYLNANPNSKFNPHIYRISRCCYSDFSDTSDYLLLMFLWRQYAPNISWLMINSCRTAETSMLSCTKKHGSKLCCCILLFYICCWCCFMWILILVACLIHTINHLIMPLIVVQSPREQSSCISTLVQYLYKIRPDCCMNLTEQDSIIRQCWEIWHSIVWVNVNAVPLRGRFFDVLWISSGHWYPVASTAWILHRTMQLFIP